MSEPKITDVFEHWLQGRINLCVTGVLHRLTFLEGKADGMSQRIERLEDRIQAQDAQIKALEHAVRLYEPGPPTLGPDFDCSELLEQLCNHEDWDDAVGSVYGTNAFNEAVGEAMTDASSLEDAVKEIICDKVSFEVRVS